MTRHDDKQRAAAVAAVIEYLDREDRGRVRRQNLWARSGRLATMQANKMVQMRMVSARRFFGF